MATPADQPQLALSPIEQRLIEHVECGETLDLAGDQSVDEAAMQTWDTTRTVSARVIRDILRGRHVTDPDPHGLRLRGARIDGRLDLENITSGMSLELTDCVLGLGVNACDADLKGLVLAGCRLSHPTEPPLEGTRLTTTVVFLDRTVIDAHAAEGAVRLLGAHLGVLECRGARLVNDSGPALNAEFLQVDQGVFFRGDFQATASGNDVVLDLSDTHIGGVLFLNPKGLEHHTYPHHKLRLDGLIYTGLPQGVTPDQWLALLRHDTIEYAAQPYQHLAAVHKAAGHDREARQVLIAQRQDQIRRQALTGRTTRTWARLTGLLLGHGYKPWRALIALAAVLTAAVIAAVILGGTYGALARVPIPPPPATPAPCTWVDQVGVGLDLGTPLLTTGTRTRCDTTNTTPGHALTIIGWTLRLLAWAFATLFIAGFTGTVRKT